MSSAEKAGPKEASCLHVSLFRPRFFYRAKPVSVRERSEVTRALRRKKRAKPVSVREQSEVTRALRRERRKARALRRRNNPHGCPADGIKYREEIISLEG